MGWFDKSIWNGILLWMGKCLLCLISTQINFPFVWSSVQLSCSIVSSLVAQSCPSLCDPMDCSKPGLPENWMWEKNKKRTGRGTTDCFHIGKRVCQGLPGASTRDPTHEKVVRRRPDKQGRSGLQGFWKAAPALTLKMISVFLMLAILDYSLISVTWVEGLPRSLSKQNQLRTLINMSPGRWYPIRLCRMKGVFPFRPFCWHSSLLGKCVLMHMTAHNTLIINSIKNLIT